MNCTSVIPRALFCVTPTEETQFNEIEYSFIVLLGRLFDIVDLIKPVCNAFPYVCACVHPSVHKKLISMKCGM